MLKISQSEYDSLRRHGEETYPHECCGALMGRFEGDDRVVEETVRCGNTRDDRPEDRFNISPGELVRIQREGRAKGLDIVGFYHSHPDHPARWSPADLAEAFWPDCSYLITAVERGRAAHTRSFVLIVAGEEKRFADEEINILQALDP